MTVYDKLVRDKIPEIIAADGREAKTHVADEAEYLAKLDEKLREEVEELIADTDPSEVADILEVLEAICDAHGWSSDDIQAIKRQKNEKRVGFTKRIILEEG